MLVTTLGDALGAFFQPVMIAVATVAVLALLRLITPAVRWSRRLKHDADVYNALPDGTEKELWAASVEAQGQRLRLYRENLSYGEQAFAWYAFFALAGFIVSFIAEASMGWPNVRSLTPGDIPFLIPVTLLVAMNLGFAVLVTVRLVLGGSTSFRADGKGHYPKMALLRRAEQKRLDRREVVERRLNAMRYRAERERKEAKRAARGIDAAAGD